jgi:preprotein translocase subunit SecE
VGGRQRDRRNWAMTTKKQPNVIVRTVRETMAELRKVSWPTRPEATQLTIVVLVVLAVMSAFLGTLDFLYSRLIAWVINLG